MSADSITASSVDSTMTAVRESGGKPYFISSGASTHPLGGLGFARWIFELEEQEAQEGLFFDTIIVPTASGSTIAGMIAGYKLSLSLQKEGMEKTRRIIGVDASARTVKHQQELVLGIARTTAAKIGLSEGDIGDEDVMIDDRYSAGAYGKTDQATVDAMKLAASTEGLITDPVYTGKAFTGMLDMIRRGELKEDSNVLFCHTGGVPVLSAYSYI
jgi:1-aminocyclopropane-1-carboxylate deaminase